ncbi:MAG: RepB family plasmid replication initiator protein, partial [Spiroplasma ixodetis]|nr:RepB family plasmid replication initiator protein [Spiroplasma ixodetis]
IDHYTSINLDNLVRFKSNHSLNLYKLICSWNDTIKTNQKFFELNLNLNRKR